ncbi:MAG TPA: hypothetical protein VMT74_05990 [Gaiellaceae bacterium]|nr:hypothetical protein [Gaiellaceae bacterium]
MPATMDDRLKEIGSRIDRLQESAKAAHGRAKDSAQERVAALRRQEASTRAAIKRANDRQAKNAAEKKQDAEERLEGLETKVKVTEHAMVADAAADGKSFANAVRGELAEWNAYFGRAQKRISSELDELQASSGDSARKLRKRIDGDVDGLNQSMDKLASRFH